MRFSKLYLHLLLIITTSSLILVSAKNKTSTALDSKNRNVVNIGLILDFDSSIGFVANSCISMAISDFYSKNPHYTTRLALHPKNSKNVLTAASAALELVDEDQVVAIIGPQYDNEARFVAEFGVISQVPVISFTMKSWSLWPSRNPYFIQTTLSDDSQLEGITSFVQQLGWHAVVVIHQDETDGKSSTGFIPSLTDAFQKANIQLSYMITISSSANESDVRQELDNLRSMRTRVFLVHVTSLDFASRLFSYANKMGLMSKGTAWIITHTLSSSLSALDAATIESMEGVLGVRSYVPESKNLEDFKTRWNTNNYLMMQQKPKHAEKIREEFDMYCLRAYDTVWAVATAVENTRFPQVKKSHEKLIASSAITSSGKSEAGPELVKEILKTEFLGLSGEFKLKHGQLQAPILEIINVVGKSDRTVGYWTPERGFSRKLASAAEKDQTVVHSKPADQVLKPIIWPGVSAEKPKGWDVPGMGLTLRVGVPIKPGFREFINVQKIGETEKYDVNGFVIDVFRAAVASLSFKLEPEFIPFRIVNDSGGSNETYDDLVNKLSDTKTPEFEAVVGDITIRAHREKNVDFSLPYSESGVVMVVRAEPDKLKNMWIFLKPLSWDLWLTIVLAAIFVGLVLRMLERPLNRQRRPGMLIFFPLAALAFPEKDMVGNNWARFVLVVWLFLAYILMQSYTANLSSILTVGQLSLSADIPACAGHQDGSFVKEFIENLRIPAKSYSNMEDFDKALSLGCKHEGIDAIYDEIPYMKLFLHRYGSKYKMVGSTYSTGGFGFAFPIGSPLSKPISEAILGVMENGMIQQIEKKYFGEGYASGYQAEDISRDSPSLTAYSFAGLFTITAFLTLLALVCSECSVFITRYRNRHTANIARVHSIEMTGDVPSENDRQDSKEDEILSQEERDQQLVQEATDTNTII